MRYLPSPFLLLFIKKTNFNQKEANTFLLIFIFLIKRGTVKCSLYHFSLWRRLQASNLRRGVVIRGPPPFSIKN